MSVTQRVAAAIKRTGALGTMRTVSQTDRDPGGIVVTNEVLTPIRYVENRFSNFQLLTGDVKPSDKRILVPADQVTNITTDDEFDIGGRSYDVDRIDMVMLKGVIVLYDLHLSQSQI